MEHITNSDGANSDPKMMKTVCSKKKSKKTKESVEIVNNSSVNVSVEDVIEDFKDKVSLHSNNGLTNGVSSDHSTNSVENLSNSNENHDSINKCERLNDVTNEKESAEVSLSKVDLSKDVIQPLESCDKTIPAVISECSDCKEANCAAHGAIEFESYRSELQMAEIMRLIQKGLSEPYSIYTYRYFIHNWPKLCFLAMHNNACIGAIVCKLDIHRKKVKRGYIAMLAVDEKYRKRKIGSHLVKQAITVMVSDDADEVVLETEITNKPALRLYENLGFVRDKRLFRYYLNGVDALRLKLWLR